MSITGLEVIPDRAWVRILIDPPVNAVAMRLTRSTVYAVDTVRGDLTRDTFAVATVATDTEAPFGVTLRYAIAYVLDDGTQTNPDQFDGSVVLPISAQWQIASVVRPVRLIHAWVGSQPARSIETPRGVFKPLGRHDPVVTFGSTRTPTGTLTLLGLDEPETRRVLDLIAAEEPLLARSPPSNGFGLGGRRFIAVTGIEVVRPIDEPTGDHNVVAQWVELADPASLWVASYAATYAELTARYVTYRVLDEGFDAYADQTAAVI